MIVVKWLLWLLGIGLFGSAGALVVYDVYVSSQLRRLLKRSSETFARGTNAAGFLSTRPFGAVRWQRVLLLSGVALLAALSF